MQLATSATIDQGPPSSLYGLALAERAEGLDQDVARLHCSTGSVHASGHLDVRRGSSLVARVAASLLRLPRSGRGVATSLAIIRRRSGEHWLRVFGDDPPVCTWQSAGSGGRVIEHIGPVQLVLAPTAAGQELRITQVGCWFAIGRWRLPLPMALAPVVEATVGPAPAKGSVRVAVSIATPLTGRLLSYAGEVSLQGDDS